MEKAYCMVFDIALLLGSYPILKDIAEKIKDPLGIGGLKLQEVQTLVLVQVAQDIREMRDNTRDLKAGLAAISSSIEGLREDFKPLVKAAAESIRKRKLLSFLR